MRVRDITDYIKGVAAMPEPRKGSDSPRLDEAEFKRRFRSQFQDTAAALCHWPSMSGQQS